MEIKDIALPFPPLPTVMFRHDQLGEMYDRVQVQQYALKYAEIYVAQLAKAEQRVAEACALQVATETKFHWLDAARVAKEIRSGEWKRYLK